MLRDKTSLRTAAAHSRRRQLALRLLRLLRCYLRASGYVAGDERGEIVSGTGPNDLRCFFHVFCESVLVIREEFFPRLCQ